MARRATPVHYTHHQCIAFGLNELVPRPSPPGRRQERNPMDPDGNRWGAWVNAIEKKYIDAFIDNPVIREYPGMGNLADRPHVSFCARRWLFKAPNVTTEQSAVTCEDCIESVRENQTPTRHRTAKPQTIDNETLTFRAWLICCRELGAPSPFSGEDTARELELFERRPQLKLLDSIATMVAVVTPWKRDDVVERISRLDSNLRVAFDEAVAMEDGLQSATGAMMFAFDLLEEAEKQIAHAQLRAKAIRDAFIDAIERKHEVAETGAA